ncbi:FecCD family ABC transporter permease [Halobacterium salinarum]|uniref:Cobalamin import system permease protein BtuC n=1 Tax=Halobacterium salinarum (strain ATCC 33171 / DSM 3754 / JCM 8978 / NBRC 102687 / NCIMB 764 / 91-R6) TaxID=2597657 RepID=A0A4D6GUE1_HALS9|nr:iron ABC transporter permease [Halobacterium salinarum]MDL0121942.1 iron ABC transporter permease [Halobacterium salinarum]MDL0132349.1 iron ABC transporter permease [Halobacterium salinarum]QCC43867.1 ABC-type transport system permease protein [Halobacterium salinarum]TYO82362.1 iron complex transport system permease protein [Halobacterium salinarum DSM 3754]
MTANTDASATRRLATLAAGSLLVVLAATLLQVSFGAYPIPIADAWHTVFDPEIWSSAGVWRTFLLGGQLPEWLSRRQVVVWNIRLPRILVGTLVGANLAVSGAIFQIVTRNELASPYILGVSNGAGMVVLLTLTLFSGLLPVMPLLAALGGAVAFLIVYAIAWKNGTNPVRLVLAGVVVSTVFGSVQRALFFFIDNLGVVMSAQTWLSGSLLGTDWAQVRIALPFTVLSLALAFLVTNELDVLLLGEETAESLGMPVEKVRFGVAGIAILSTAAAIAVAGLIGFVGLIVPHMVRNIVGNDTRDLLAGCVVLGPALLVGADVGARLALDPVQLPVGIITGLVGGPYFLYLMRRTENLGDI